jgi:hypothetical protein
MTSSSTSTVLEIADGIRLCKMVAYRNQIQYFVSIIPKLYEINGFREKFEDKSQSKNWSAEIKQIRKRIVGVEEATREYVVAEAMMDRVDMRCPNPKSLHDWLKIVLEELKDDDRVRIAINQREELYQSLKRSLKSSVGSSIQLQSNQSNHTNQSNTDKKRGREVSLASTIRAGSITSSTSSNEILGTSSSYKDNCKMCGRRHLKPCRLANHRDANRSRLPWPESTQGKKWLERHEEFLPGDKSLSGLPPMLTEKEIEASYQRSKVTSKFKPLEVEHLLTFASRETITFKMKVMDRQETIEVLLDDGALDGNYISSRIVEKNLINLRKVDSHSCTICTGFSNLCSTCKGIAAIEISFYDEIADAIHPFIAIEAKVIDTPFDLIIGKYYNIDHNLSNKLRYQFQNSRLMNSPETDEFRS